MSSVSSSPTSANTASYRGDYSRKSTKRKYDSSADKTEKVTRDAIHKSEESSSKTCTPTKLERIKKINENLLAGNFLLAEQLTQILCKIDPNCPDVRFLVGKTFSRSNKFSEALTELNLALRLLNKNSMNYAKSLSFINAERINANLALGRLSEAETLLAQRPELETEAQKRVNTVHKISLLFAQNKHMEAIAECNSLLDKNPDYQDPKLFRGLSYLAINDFSKAEKDLRAYKGGKTAVIAGLGKIALLFEKDYKKAHALLASFLRDDERFIQKFSFIRGKIFYETIRMYAESLLSHGKDHEDISEAERLYTDVLIMDPDRELHVLGDLSGLAECQTWSGNHTKALENYNRILSKKIDYANGKPLLSRASILIKINLSKALDDVEAALKLKSEDYGVLWDSLIRQFELLINEADANQKERISSIISQRRLQKNPNDLEALFDQGLYLLKLKRYEAALPLINRYLSIVPKPVEQTEKLVRDKYCVALNARVEIYTFLQEKPKVLADQRLILEISRPNSSTSIPVPVPSTVRLASAAMASMAFSVPVRTTTTTIPTEIPPLERPEAVPKVKLEPIASSSSSSASAALASSASPKQAPVPAAPKTAPIFSEREFNDVPNLNPFVRTMVQLKGGIYMALTEFSNIIKASTNQNSVQFCKATLHAAICHIGLKYYSNALSMLNNLIERDPTNYEAIAYKTALCFLTAEAKNNYFDEGNKGISFLKKSAPYYLNLVKDVLHLCLKDESNETYKKNAEKALANLK